MKFTFTQEWLERKLAHCDDANVAAAGTSFGNFKKDVEQRTVTPPILSSVPTELGKVVRFVREQKGWSRTDMAELADVDEADIELLETLATYDPKPRTVVQLANVCHFSREKFIQLANHRFSVAANDISLRFAANSKGTDSITDAEYDAIRALVEALSSQD